MPLILKGRAKKIIAISSGFAFADLAIKYNVCEAAPYTISKTALNMIVAKFHAQYAPEGILVMTISPGMVDTGNGEKGKDLSIQLFCNQIDIGAVPAEELPLAGQMVGKFTKYAPGFKGPTPIDIAVGQMLSVMEKASIKGGDGGTSVSQYGDQQWL
jgi:NAD(P)-dependent dehydrogenase (short-subunit alcohol dehydrogenase family)